MDTASLAEGLLVFALAIALAASAGLRAWLPLLLAGALARMGVLDLGPSFAFLSSNTALVLFAIATAIEIAGDKVPAIDHALDLVGTPLRPAAGALLAASVLGSAFDPLTSLVLGVAVGAPSALVPHAVKSGLRGMSTAATGGLANPVLSLIEDALSVALVLVAVFVPLLVVGLLGFAVYRLVRAGGPGPRAVATARVLGCPLVTKDRRIRGSRLAARWRPPARGGGTPAA